MDRRSRRTLTLVTGGVMVGGLALLMAACGGSGTPYSAAGGGAAPTQASVVTAPTAAATTPEAGGASAGDVKPGMTGLGMVLTDGSGMTLYTFDNDKAAGTSACNGGCASTWPPLTTAASVVPPVAAAGGTFSLFGRDDGSKQVAYNDRPLYRFASDRAAGETNGDGVGGIWHVARP